MMAFLSGTEGRQKLEELSIAITFAGEPDKGSNGKPESV